MSNLDFFNHLPLNHWTWLVIAASLIIFEILLGANFFLLWLGIVAMVVGGIVWLIPALSIEFQLLFFSIGSIFILLFWKYYLRKHPIHSKISNLNRRSEQLIGRTFTLKEAIVNGRGKIKAGDTVWTVEGPELPANTQVKVVGVQGVTLKVVKSE